MSSTFLYTIRIPIRLSPWFRGLFTGIHLGSVLVVLSLSLSWTVETILILCVCGSFCVTARRFNQGANGSYPLTLILNRFDEWTVILPDGTTRPARLLRQSFVHPCLVVLRFDINGRQVPVILTPDCTDADSFRRLRVRIKFRRSALS